VPWKDDLHRKGSDVRNKLLLH